MKAKRVLARDVPPVMVRLSPLQRQVIDGAAKATGEPLGAFLRTAGLGRAAAMGFTVDAAVAVDRAPRARNANR